MASPQALRISAAARLFTVLALAGPALWMREPGALFAVFAFALIWINGVLTQWRPRLALFPVGPIAEAALIGAICGFAVMAPGWKGVPSWATYAVPIGVAALSVVAAATVV